MCRASMAESFEDVVSREFVKPCGWKRSVSCGLAKVS